jgi:hypothetical protein
VSLPLAVIKANSGFTIPGIYGVGKIGNSAHQASGENKELPCVIAPHTAETWHADKQWVLDNLEDGALTLLIDYYRPRRLWRNKRDTEEPAPKRTITRRRSFAQWESGVYARNATDRPED